MEIKGFDTSQWESKFSFSAVKNSEYKFVILRGGYTGYGQNRTKNKDTRFEKFYKDAKDNGIALGVYYYACAMITVLVKQKQNFSTKIALKEKPLSILFT